MLHQHILTYTQFLTVNLTPLLMLYLQEVDAHGLANAEHTTLLLIAYAKVGDVVKVDAFVRSEGRIVGTVVFDGKTALCLILTWRFVYDDKRGSLSRPHT
jgi:hypothetical protein